jgi:beta-xylosidase
MDTGIGGRIWPGAAMSGIVFTTDLKGGSDNLRHHWKHCVGSGHAALGLRTDWQEQLGRCHRELGLRHVRCHGVLDDDVGTLVVEQGKPRYSFVKADALYAGLERIGMSPLVELSFMPRGLASGDQTVFHYQANVTPPRDPALWVELITRLVGHWQRHFGREVLQHWLFEVWNEPNLPAFWSGGRDGYFELYERTARAIKAVSPELRVGGPATAMNAWLPEFLAFCDRRQVPCDFLSTHVYPTDALGTQVTDTEAQLAGSDRHIMRRQMEAARGHAYGRPLYLTEWSITSNPRDPLHDQPIAAVYALKAAMEMSPFIDGSSWWTFSDIFEEHGFPAQPFHGGFGLLSLQGIAKPVYRALQLLAPIGDRQLPVEGCHATVDCHVVRGKHRIDVLLGNLVLPHQAGQAENVSVRISNAARPSRVVLRRIDEDHAHARREWVSWGAPESLQARQIEALHAASELQEEQVAWTWDDTLLEISVTVPVNGIAAITCEYAPEEPAWLESVASFQARRADDDQRMLMRLQKDSYTFFLKHVDHRTGLVRDSSESDSPDCIAATGMALACYPLAVERGFLTRSDAATLTLTAIRTMLDAPQGPELDATGYHGFYYHFLNPRTGRRTLDCELSTIDSALLIAGALMAGAYFTGDHPIEREIRDASAEMNARADWTWALAGGEMVCHGWDPVHGFIPYRWEGYCEALVLYALALGSPRHAIDPSHYQAWTRTYAWKTVYDIEYLYAGPLFIHQMSHCWIDFRAIHDDVTRAKGWDYFENSRRATRIQQRYAQENLLKFKGYSDRCWGVTACEGPGPRTLLVDGVCRSFLGYEARGVPFGPDDGTLAPWAVLASLPFAPEIVLPTVRNFIDMRLHDMETHGFITTFNPSYPGGPDGWISQFHYGLNQGPVLLMIENYLTGQPWKLMQGCVPLVRGLRRAGFQGGWLDALSPQSPR